ncbi:MAG: acyl-CoA dehydrogenase family protein [Betaproteobacteria bacterium]|nr:acyl-CoA dehydrogenase family protein [Betaproteobacteria bacterium]
MDFALTPEQAQLKESVARFAQSELNQDLPQRDREQAFNRAGWQRCAETGIQGLPVPRRYGGQEADPLTTSAALEGLGYGCRDNGLCFAINAHLWGCVQPILTFGSESQKERFLPRLCSGEWIGALAVSEREAGSDAYSLKTRAARDGDRYLLTGSKMFVTNGPVADLILVFATVDPAKGAHGITGFLVEKGTPGLRAGPTIEKMGLRTVPMGELTLESCAVPVENRIGAEGAGLALFNHAMEWERGFILAGAVGAMQRQLEQCRQHARTRRQFGQPIGAFQLVSSKLVDMQLRLEAARLLLYKVAWLKSHKRPALMEASQAKLFISEAWVQSCQDAMQIHGGYGYLTESEVERDLRDALASRLFSGTSEIQRQVIAHWLGLP